jgi:hypothetical protein
MSYRAMKNTVTGYISYCLLQGRGMTLPNNDNLKARVAKQNPVQSRRIENLRTGFKLLHKQMAKAKRKAHKKHNFLWSLLKSAYTVLQINQA